MKNFVDDSPDPKPDDLIGAWVVAVEQNTKFPDTLDAVILTDKHGRTIRLLADGYNKGWMVVRKGVSDG